MNLLIRTLFVLFCLATLQAHSAVETDDRSLTKENLTDVNGHRQGYWRITGAISVEEGYRKNQVIEEGEYRDNKREGMWRKYYPTGSLKSEITYEDNHPMGAYTVYYPSGQVEEEGLWLINRNTGDFTRYHENGNVSQKFHFNSAGKRQGVQEYYFENGQLQMAVELDNGIVHGSYKTFYSDGSPQCEKRMTNGEVEEGSEVNFKPKSKSVESASLPELPRRETKPVTTDKPNLAEFKADGFNTLYNKNKQVTQVGKFIKGRLWEGKWYRYDENGLLKRVEVYKDGRFIGYGIIDDTNN